MELEELGTPLPAGMKEAKVKSFPTPGSVIDKVIDPQRKQMLKRLYPEYKRLCALRSRFRAIVDREDRLLGKVSPEEVAYGR